MPDNLTPEQRSYCMSRIKAKDTGPEVRVRSALHRMGLRFRKHTPDLPGKPDIVFPRARVVVFIDGDFWHGYKFSTWKDSVSPFWREKISRNRERDAGNDSRLRESGWTVIRLWQHEVQEDFDRCIATVQEAVVRQWGNLPNDREQTIKGTRVRPR